MHGLAYKVTDIATSELRTFSSAIKTLSMKNPNANRSITNRSEKLSRFTEFFHNVKNSKLQFLIYQLSDLIWTHDYLDLLILALLFQ